MSGHASAEPSWRRTVAGAVLLDLAVSTLFAWDVFVRDIAEQLRVEPSSLAIVFSAGLGAFTVGVLGGGRLADRLPPRVLTLAAAAVVALGLAVTAAASSLPLLVAAFGVAVGGSTGVGYAVAVRTAGSLSTRRGLALGLTVSAYAAGTIAVAPAAAFLLNRAGRTTTFLVLAVVTAGVLVLAAVLLPRHAPTPTTPRGRQRGAVYSVATLRLWLVFGMGSAPGLAAFAHAGAITPAAGSAGLSVAVLSVGNLTGRLVAGPGSDRIGRTRALYLTVALLAASCLVLAATDRPVVSLAALAALGTQYGALSALTPAATADTVPTDRLGATYGVIFTGWGVGGLLAPVVAAAVASHVGWNLAMLCFLVPAAISAIALALPSRLRSST